MRGSKEFRAIARKKRKKIEADALKAIVRNLNWDGISIKEEKILGDIICGLSQIQSPTIYPEVSRMAGINGIHTISIGGWTTEIDIEKLRQNCLNTELRPDKYQYIKSLKFNPSSDILTATIDTRHKEEPNQRNNRRRRRELSEQWYQDPPPNMVLQNPPDFSNVEIAHRASIVDVLLGIAGFANATRKSEDTIVVAPKNQDTYKIIVRELEKDLDVEEIYQNMLGEGNRRGRCFQYVRSVGFDSRSSGFIVRVGKMKHVRQKKSNAYISKSKRRRNDPIAPRPRRKRTPSRRR